MRLEHALVFRLMSLLALPLLALLALVPLAPAQAQDASVFPLPADLYILTSEQRVLRIDATTGEQTTVSPEGQPLAAFDIAPDGGWYAYRTLDNLAVIVASLNRMSGFVVEFDQSLPPGPTGQSIAWSPHGSRLAYTVPDGVRVMELSGYGMGEMPASTVQGGPWTSVTWLDDSTLVAADSAGSRARVTDGAAGWIVEPAPADLAPRAAVESSLTPNGVQLADGRLIPGTAGALAFDWGPLPLPALPAGMLPASLYFLAANEAGVIQVWRLPASGELAHAVTASDQPIVSYAVAGGQVAAVTADEVQIAHLDGGAAQSLATLVTGRVRPSAAFNADGSQLAFSDDRGLWIISPGVSQAPRLVVQNVLSDDPATIRVYSQPRWTSDSTRLLVTIGLYEGSYLGVIDLASGAVTELPTSFSSVGRWTVDGRVASSSASMGYSTPGLYLLDPAAPEAEPISLLGPDTPVFDAAQRADGTWAVIVGSSAEMGPQWMRLLRGSAESGISPAFGAEIGAFLEDPALAPLAGLDTLPTLAAGLRNVTYGPDGIWGELVIADLSSGEVWAVPAPQPVSQVEWAP